MSKSHPKRYFINTLQDYEKDSNLFTNQKWNSKIHETVNIITDRQDPSVNAADGGLYVGIAGIGYMFYHTSLSPAFVSEKSELLKRGLKYIIPALKYAERHERDKSAFLLGNAGIYAVAAAVYNALGMLHLLIYLLLIVTSFDERQRFGVCHINFIQIWLYDPSSL